MKISIYVVEVAHKGVGSSSLRRLAVLAENDDDAVAKARTQVPTAPGSTCWRSLGEHGDVVLLGFE